MRQRRAWGQTSLFAQDGGRRKPSFRVADGGRLGPPAASIPMAAAQARAVALALALAGRQALICADDGTAAVVTHGPGGFTIAVLDSEGWPETVRRILSHHG